MTLTKNTGDERSRLAALARYDILDTPPEDAFDRVTRIVRRALRVPMATVTFIDAHRQWFKSRQGISASEGERNIALCDFAIRQREPLIVPDTHKDDRFSANPLVTGEPRLRFYAGVPLRDPNGYELGTLCAMDTVPRELGNDELEMLTDLSRVVMSEMELRVLASEDSLTGTLSRRSFRAEASKALALAQRHHHDVSCILFDLDHFKSVNDTYGHPVGDIVLADTAAVCRSLLRESDIFGRMGGEEFAILLPHTGKHASAAVAEKLREAISAQLFTANERTFKVTASMGVVTAVQGRLVLDAMLKLADDGLYRAKASGRDRVVALPPE